MNHPMKKALWVLVASGFLLQACGGETSSGMSTQVGNPPEGEERLSTPTAPQIYGFIPTDLHGLVHMMCQQIDSASYGRISIRRCEDDVAEIDGFDVALGFPDTDFSTLEDMLAAENRGELPLEWAESVNCIYGMMDIEFTDSLMQDAISGLDSGHPEDVLALLTNNRSCGQMAAVATADTLSDL